jgi:hypothetical protein
MTEALDSPVWYALTDRARNLQDAEEAERRDKMNGAESLVRTL